MTTTEMEQQFTAVLTRWKRTLADAEGVPAGLLQDLAAIADRHALAAVPPLSKRTSRKESTR